MPVCPSCGTDTPTESNFCLKCGYEIFAATGRLSPETLLENRYVIVETLGRGGMGAVYKALDTRLDRTPVAIKEMSSSALGTGKLKEAIEAFKREAKMLIALRHPSLPRITDFFSQGDDRWYLVMDYIEGESLESVARRRGAVPEHEVLSWAKQLCEVLDYLHSQEPMVVFRDLKPSNIMLTPRNEIKLIDFGIARHFKPGLTTDTSYYGSTGFSPPEQYGESQTDARSDIYGLGATLHYLLTGMDPSRKPFRFDPPSDTVTVSPEMEKAVMQAVEFKHENRPSSVKEFLEMLPEQAEPPKAAPKTEAVLTPVSKQDATQKLERVDKKKSFIWIAAAAIILIAFVGIGYGTGLFGAARQEVGEPQLEPEAEVVLEAEDALNETEGQPELEIAAADHNNIEDITLDEGEEKETPPGEQPEIIASAHEEIPAAEQEPVTVAVTGVTLNQSSLSLTAGGQTTRLTATVQPADAANKDVTWESSNTSVATVSSNGTVTPLSTGTATITVKTADGAKTAACRVAVEPAEPQKPAEPATVAVSGVTLSRNTLSLKTGETANITATVQPDDATNKAVTWSSSNTSVATVSNGVVTAVSAGSATITARTAGGSHQATCTVTVTVSVTGVTLNRSSLNLTAGEKTEQLTATVVPGNATNKNITWSSSNTSVATVSNGVVTAVSAGSANITVSTADGNHTAACQVTVTAPITSTQPLSDLKIGDRVVDKSWRWQHRTGSDYTGSGTTKPVTWIVVAKNHYGANSGVTLLAEELIGIFTFDNSTNIHSWGSNHWGDSGTHSSATHGLRHWLTSSFYHAFSQSFKDAVLITSVPNREWQQGSTYTTRDRVFVPSTTELGAGHSNTYQIGTVYPYFANASNTDRVAKLAGNSWWHWTRSPFASNAYNVRGVRSVGDLSSGNAFYSRGGARPALNLKSGISVSEIPDRNGVYEIVWN